MKSLLKKAAVGGLIIAAFSLTGSTALAQQNPRAGWSASQVNTPHLGPPGFSVQPPEPPRFNGNIAEFRQAIRDWVMELRLWVRSSFGRS